MTWVRWTLLVAAAWCRCTAVAGRIDGTCLSSCQQEASVSTDEAAKLAPRCGGQPCRVGIWNTVVGRSSRVESRWCSSVDDEEAKKVWKKMGESECNPVKVWLASYVGRSLYGKIGLRMSSAESGEARIKRERYSSDEGYETP